MIGGAANGIEHMQAAARAGGAATKAKYGADYFSRIGKLGGRPRTPADS